MIVVTDLAGRIRDINDLLVETSGFTREELIGSTHAVMHSGRHDRAFYEDLWGTISADRIWRGTLCNRAKSGHLYWLATTIGPLFDSKGRKVGYIGLRTDVTREKLGHLLLEREQSLHARLHRRGRLSSLVGELLTEIEDIRPELRLAVMRIGARGRFRLLAAPRMPVSYRELVEGAAVGESDLIGARAARERRAVFLCDSESGTGVMRTAGVEVERLMRDCAEAGAWWSFPIQGPAGEVLGVLDAFVASARPPDEIECYLLETLAASLAVALFHQRSIELYRRYMADIETLSLQREGVLRTIGHEMRTPLNHILGFADLLIRDVGNPRMREWAAFIRAAGRELLHKVEKSENFLSAEPQGERLGFDLTAYLKDLLGEWAMRHDREITVDIPNETLHVHVSREDLDKSLNYLLENIERHTPEKTTVRLSCSRRGSEAEIDLSDDGPGMQEGERGAGGLIRETRELSENRGGLGLGLAAARHLIQRNGGRMITGTSTRDGFSVLIRLPLANEAARGNAGRNGEDPAAARAARRGDQD